jgi:hypothetical protein
MTNATRRPGVIPKTAAPAPEDMAVQCNSHPEAPHGFLRDASHLANRYVCECESWRPEGNGELAQPLEAYATAGANAPKDDSPAELLARRYQLPESQVATLRQLWGTRSEVFVDDGFVGYYWIGDDNRQQFSGSFDTLSTETANRAEKVYTRPEIASARAILEAARDADLARFSDSSDELQMSMRAIAADGWRKALAALEA